MNNNSSRLWNSVPNGHGCSESSSILGSKTYRPSDSGGSPKNLARSTLGNATRWELIERNLREGLAFLGEQDLKLGLAGSLLDQYRKILGKSKEGTGRRTRLRLMHEVLARGLLSIRGETFRGTPLFDDGTSDPLKFHVCEDGLREVLEVTRANLFSPALMAITFIDSQAPPGQGVTLEATREVLEMRTVNRRQSERLGSARERVLSRMELRRKHRSTILGKGMGRTTYRGEGNPSTGERTVSFGWQILARILPRKLTALARFSQSIRT